MPLKQVTASDDRSLQELADILANTHKVLIITGAGISTSCGIPDFRSKDGLYNLIPEQSLPTPPASRPATPQKRKRSIIDDGDIASSSQPPNDPPSSSQSSTASSQSRRSSTPAPKLKGQDLFDSSVWKSAAATEVFYQTIASLRETIREEVKDTSATHKFIRTLRDGGRLIRCYTQNIDGLEAREGLCMDMSRGRGNKRRFMKKHYEAPLPEDRIDTDFDGGCEVVALHGDLEQVRCTLCQGTYDWTETASEAFLAGYAPGCEECSSKSDRRVATGKRGLAVGSLRPNIVLYGEEHPSNHLLSPLVPFDVASGPEVLLIMGTSLKVFGLQKVLKNFAKAVHAKKDGNGRVILVNRTKPAESVWDGIIDDYVAMDCDDWVEDLHLRRPDLWLRQGELHLRTTKTATKRKRNADDGPGDTPTKKTKVVIAIPRLPSHMNQQYLLHTSVEEPEARANDPTTGSNKLVTPRKSKSWKKNVHDNPLATLLSPLKQQKPAYSPLKRAFKPLVLADMDVMPDSPQRPEWSPISMSLPLRHQIEREDSGTAETDGKQQNRENQEVRESLKILGGDTPTKPKTKIERLYAETDPEKENSEPQEGLPAVEDDDAPQKTMIRRLYSEMHRIRTWTKDTPIGKILIASTTS